MLQDLKITNIHIGDELHIYGQVTYVEEVQAYDGGIIFISPSVVVPDIKYTTQYVTLSNLINHGKYIYHWRVMTPQEIRTIQKNRTIVDRYLYDKLNVNFSKYLGPITEEEYEERVAIKNIIGRINEDEAKKQAYIEITDYYINKDTLFK